MKISTKALGIVALVCVCAAAGAVSGVVTVERERIISSTLDSSPVGSATPSTGSFTTLQASQTASFPGGIVAPNGGVITSATWNGGIINNAVLNTPTLNGNVSGNPIFYGTAQFNNTINANITGNSSTANALLNTPTACPYGSNSNAGYYRPAEGIGGSGNAICGPIHAWTFTTGGTCSTGSTSYSTCPVTLNWYTPFPDTNYSVVCQGIGPSSSGSNSTGAATLVIQSVSASTVTALVETQAGASVTFAGLYCSADHQ